MEDVQEEILENELVKYKRIERCKGKAAAVFKLKDSIFRSKKAPLDPIAIKDPNTGLQVMSPKEIKEVSLNYCIKLLTNRDPMPNFKDQFSAKVSLHMVRMNEVINNDIDELTPIMFQEAIDVISKKNGWQV